MSKETCLNCDGLGNVDLGGPSPTTCPACNGTGYLEVATEPAPDLLALLKRCKPWLEHERDYYKNKGNALPLSATKANAKITASELDALLSDIAKAEEGR